MNAPRYGLRPGTLRGARFSAAVAAALLSVIGTPERGLRKPELSVKPNASAQALAAFLLGFRQPSP